MCSAGGAGVGRVVQESYRVPERLLVLVSWCAPVWLGISGLHKASELVNLKRGQSRKSWRYPGSIRSRLGSSENQSTLTLVITRSPS